MAESKLEVPAELRELAEKTIDQAEKAFEMFFDAAGKSMASMPGVHFDGLTTTVETVAAGGFMVAKYCWIILSRNRLKPTMPPTTRTSRMKAMMKRLIKKGPLGRLAEMATT